MQQAFIYSSLFLWGIALFYLWQEYNVLKSKWKIHESDLRIKTAIQENFKWFYDPLQALLEIIWILFVFGLGILVLQCISDIQRNFYSNSNTISFSSTFASELGILFVYCLIAPTAFIGRYILNKYFIHFDHYYALTSKLRQQLRFLSWHFNEKVLEEASGKYNADNITKKSLVYLYAFTCLSWIIFPIFILAFDNYIRIDNDGIHSNDFMSIGEKYTSWNDIKEVGLFSETHTECFNRSCTKHFYPHLIINLKDRNDYYDAWASLGMTGPALNQIEHLVIFLHQKNIPIKYAPISASNDQILSYTSKETYDGVHHIFDLVSKY
jgi:hypothetical protein